MCVHLREMCGGGRGSVCAEVEGGQHAATSALCTILLVPQVQAAMVRVGVSVWGGGAKADDWTGAGRGVSC